MWLLPNCRPGPNSERSGAFVFLTATLLSSVVLFATPSGASAQPASVQPKEQEPVSSADSSSPGSEQARSALALQAGGGSYMFGLQYHYRWVDHWVGRAGLGGGAIINPLFFFDDTEDITDEDILGVAGMPLGVSWVPGSGDVRPEVGVSVAPGLIGGAVPVLWGGPSVGVRYRPLDGGLFVRAVGKGLLGTAAGGTLGILWFGVSLGYAF